MTSAKYFETVINWYLSAGGVQVSEPHYQDRLEICRGCDRHGTISLPFGLKTDGCKECGCPSATKPRVLRFMHPTRLKIETVECPLGKWADTDNNHLKK